MLEMKNWRINASPMLEIGIAGENNARLLKIDADEPSMDYAWKLEIEHQQSGEKNIVDLNRDGNILSVLLTRDMIRHCGVHYMQVRGVRGEEVKKSNRFYVMVGESISASDSLPPLPPSEFAQMEARITALKAEVERLTASASASERGAAESLAQAVRAAADALEAAQEAGARAQTAAQSAGDAAASRAAAEAACAATEAALAQALQAVAAAEAARDAAQKSCTDAQDAANRAEASAQAIADAQQAAEAARDAARQAAQDAADALAGIQPAKEQAIEEIKAEGAAQISAATAQAELASEAAGQAAESAETSRVAADRAESAAIHQPYPDASTGTWWCWDVEAGAYRDSGIKAKADELHIAASDVLGGVQPVTKTDTMTIPVGVDDAGRLYSGKDPDVDRLKNDLAANANSDAATKRSLDALWKLNQGISYQFETDDAEGYQKTVPSGAKLASVEIVGGHTEVIDGEIVSADINSVVVNGRNMYPGWNVKFSINTGKYIVTTDYSPNSSRANFVFYDGEGNIVTDGVSVSHTYITNNKSFQISSDLKKLSIVISITNDNVKSMKIYGAHSTFKPYINIMVVRGETGMDYLPYHEPIAYAVPEAVRTLQGYGWSAGDAYNSINRMETGWQYVQRIGSREHQDGDTVTDGVTTYYVLDEPVITDITELMAGFPDHFEVEAGGTLTFENAAQLSVPNSVEYLISLVEVNG